MVKKKTTKEIRAIDRIIKFQIDDGIESLTIGGKEALADLEIDNKNNVTLYLNADKDKINELHSLVPFINLAVNEYWSDPDKQKSVTLSQDLTQFALEIADNSKELASLIKSESSIILDLDGLIKQLLEIAGKMAELEAKDLEQDNRLTDIEAKDLEQDNRLTVIESKDLEQDNRLTDIEAKDLEQDNRLTVIESKDLDQDNRLTVIESKDIEQDNKLTELVSKDIEQDERLIALEHIVTDYRTEIITTVAPYYEEPFKSMDVYGTFDTTHHLRANIGDYMIRYGIVFITIHRYVGETYDGNATVVGMFDESIASVSGFVQEHVVEMKTILSGNVKIYCKLLDTEMQPHFIIYNVPNDNNEKYEISVRGFRFVPQQVLVPNEPIS